MVPLNGLQALVHDWEAPILVGPRNFQRVAELMREREAACLLWDTAPDIVREHLLIRVSKSQDEITALCALKELATA